MVTAYDDHIADGLSLSYGTVSVDLTTSDAVSYLMTPPGATMTRSGSQLTLDPRPQWFGSTGALNSYVLAGGTFGVAVYMGQQAADPSDLSIRVATWGTGIR